MELSHELDIAHYILGEYTPLNSIILNNNILNIHADEIAHITARSTDNCLIGFRLNFCTSPPRRTLVLRSDREEIIWDVLKRSVLINHDQLSEPIYFSTEATRDDRIRNHIQSVFDSISSDAPPICSLQDGLFVMDVISKAHALCSYNRDNV